MKPSFYLKKGDILLLVFLFVSTGVLFLSPVNRNRGKSVEISVDNRLVHELVLSQNCEMNIQCPNGGVQIKIENGKMWIVQSTCPHKICVKTGKIYRKGEMIVCVPNRFVARITGAANTQIDGLTM